MEIKITPAGTEFVTYIGGDGYSAPVVYKKTFNTAANAQEQMLYLHRDYQGSLLAITNEVGAIVEKRLFDAWGSLLSIQNGSSQPIANGQWLLDRGYTGHEHLQSVGLIHMNGRLYDPKLHRFLQPDNYVQDPSNTQNYNRYSYVLNNPLKYTDYSGETWWSDNWRQVVTIAAVVVVSVAVTIATAGMASPVAAAMITGAAAGFTGGTLGTALNGGSFGQSVFAGFKGAVIGGAIAGIGYGVSLMTPAGAFTGASYGGTTGFVLGGFGSELSGGNFMDGAISGAVFGMIGGGIQGYNSAEARGLNPWTGGAKANTVTTVDRAIYNANIDKANQEAKIAFDKAMKAQTEATNFNGKEIAKIDIGKQGKHIYEHNNYKAGNSLMLKDGQTLIDNFNSGKVKSFQIINDSKVRVNFGETMGIFIDQTGSAYQTTNGIIHISKNGVHIVPSRP